MSNLKSAIDKLVLEVKAQFDFDIVGYNAGASSIELAPIVAQFPCIGDELKEWFEIGFDCLPPYEMFNPVESITKFDALVSQFEELNGGVDEALVWDDSIPNGEQHPKHCAGTPFWNKGWVPVGEFETQTLFVDFAPGSNGQVGQVVCAYETEMGLTVQGLSIQDWILRIAKAVEDGVFDDFLIISSDMINSDPISSLDNVKE